MDDAMATIRDMETEVDGEDRPVLELFAEELQTLSDEVTETGSAGTVTLKIAVKPKREHGRATLSIEPTISRTVPKRKLGGLIRFNRNGRLSRNDERQPRLPLRSVETDTAATRDVDTASAVAREV